MEIIDDGIVLSVRRFGERAGIATLLTAQHGILCGLVKQATSKTTRGILLAGNRVNARWHARLNEQLGTFTLELQQPVAAHLMNDALALAGLNSAASMLATYLPEREANPILYRDFSALIDAWMRRDVDCWHRYVELELEILASCGFGLDIGECVLTGATEGLTHVSPRSGRAVCGEAAEPYLAKLLRLPAFLGVEKAQKTALCRDQVIDGLTLAGYFLTSWLADAAGRPLPPARARLVALLNEAPKSSMELPHAFAAVPMPEFMPA